MSEERAVAASAVPLEELSSWPEELCRRELPTVLPRLLSMYQHSDSWTEHIQILKIIVEMLLPHMNHLTLEQTFFSQVLPKTVKLFDDMMFELTSQARELSSQNSEVQSTLRNILQTMAQVLGALTGCVQHACATQGPVVLDSIQSLPSSVLHVIRSTFVHCKNSESVYAGRLHLVSDLLQALFKEAYSLQKQLMELLDMVRTDPVGDAKGGALDMAMVIHSLLDICSVISSMDHAFHANTWKFIIKQSVKHQAGVKSQLRHRDIVTSLCEDTLCSFQAGLQLAEQMAQAGVQDNADYKLFQKTLKLCRFFANSLLHYTKEFLPFLSDSCSALHQLYLQTHSKCPPSLFAAGLSSAQQEEVVASFLGTLDPLITQLLAFQPFVHVVLDSKLELPSELQFPQCLLLLAVMDKLPSQPEHVQALWCAGSRGPGAASRVSLLRAIFCSFEQCSGELSLPVRLQGVKGEGQAEAAVTLYQHVCVHLCAFIASLHPSLFPELDSALLDAVLSANMIAAVLAVDAWCFLARYGTAELCAHHVALVARLIKSCPGECHQLTNLSILLRRLFFFMAPSHQVQFLQEFPPREAENLPLWPHVPFQAFPEELRKQAAQEAASAGAAQSRGWLASSRTAAELQSLDEALSALLAVCSSASDALEVGQQAELMEVGSQLWASLHSHLVSGQRSVQQTLSLVLPLLGFFVQTLDPQLISQVVALQAVLLQSEPPDHVRLAVLDFAASLGTLLIPPALQDSLLPALSSVFALLLADRSWLLEQHALEAFMRFAEGTSHEEIVPQCLSSEETKNKVVSFLEKTGLVGETAAARVERVQREKGLFWRSLARATSGGARPSSAQPHAKRARGEPCLEEEYRSALQAATGALEAIGSLLRKSPAPGWLPREMQLLQEKMACPGQESLLPPGDTRQRLPRNGGLPNYLNTCSFSPNEPTESRELNQ
ncbi:FIGNL1-interacting regulator of recombination and mitosis [Glossophaga mutica]